MPRKKHSVDEIIRKLQQENARLKRAVADLTLNNQILKEVSEGKW